MTDQVTDQVKDTDQGQDQGQDSPGWRSALSDEYKEDAWLKTFDKPTEFAKAAIGIKTEHETLQAKMEDAIFMPGENATEAEITAFRNAMGIPESADDYEFPKAEGVEHDESTTEWARGIFHEAGLTKTQAAVISQAWDKYVMEVEKAELAASVEAENEARVALKAEWGAGFEENMKFIRRGWKEFTDSDLDEFMKSSGLGNHPLLLRFMFRVGKAMGEDFAPPSPPPKLGGPKGVPSMEYEGMEHFKD
jgi:hypothetical protein